MPEPRSTESRRKARAGLVSVRIGPRVYWVPSALAMRIERLASGGEVLQLNCARHETADK